MTSLRVLQVLPTNVLPYFGKFENSHFRKSALADFDIRTDIPETYIRNGLYLKQKIKKNNTLNNLNEPSQHLKVRCLVGF